MNKSYSVVLVRKSNKKERVGVNVMACNSDLVNDRGLRKNVVKRIATIAINKAYWAHFPVEDILLHFPDIVVDCADLSIVPNAKNYYHLENRANLFTQIFRSRY